jgi:hypothetical protein
VIAQEITIPIDLFKRLIVGIGDLITDDNQSFREREHWRKEAESVMREAMKFLP